MTLFDELFGDSHTENTVSASSTGGGEGEGINIESLLKITESIAMPKNQALLIDIDTLRSFRQIQHKVEIDRPNNDRYLDVFRYGGGMPVLIHNIAPVRLSPPKYAQPVNGNQAEWGRWVVAALVVTYILLSIIFM